MLQLNKRYLLLTVLLFVTELLIALYVHDRFIRPYFGDVLVVILMYCFVKTFFKIPTQLAAIGVLLFSYGVEMLQYFSFVERIQLEKSTVLKTAIGSSFEWYDLVAYTFGYCIVLAAEKIFGNTQNKISVPLN